MIEALRTLQVRIAEASPSAGVAAEVTRVLAGAADALKPFAVPDVQRIAGRVLDVPGRAQALVPPIFLTAREQGRMTGSVRINAMYLGSGGAAHGGVIALIFDELMGKLANLGWFARTRTAFLKVNYRAVVPADLDLKIEVQLEREEGRKLFIAGTLSRNDQLLADAEALFVIPKPGLP